MVAKYDKGGVYKSLFEEVQYYRLEAQNYTGDAAYNTFFLALGTFCIIMG